MTHESRENCALYASRTAPALQLYASSSFDQCAGVAMRARIARGTPATTTGTPRQRRARGVTVEIAGVTPAITVGEFIWCATRARQTGCSKAAHT